MRITLLKPADYIEARWSGGTTTQLAIEPGDAVYADRSFLWRISSASVDEEESDFTPLPDYDRLISTLCGEMSLAHNGGERHTLRPYEVHGFAGGGSTHSWGKCRDFNLMLRKGEADGSLCALRFDGGDRKDYTPQKDRSVLFLFCAEGTAAVRCGDIVCAVGEWDSLRMENDCGQSISVSAESSAVLMIAEMWHC